MLHGLHADSQTLPLTGTCRLHRPARRSSVSAVCRGCRPVLMVPALMQATGKVDPWVEFTMQDPTREGEPDQLQLSTCIPNEPNPRWGDKFDFIDVSPTSTLVVQVLHARGRGGGVQGLTEACMAAAG